MQTLRAGCSKPDKKIRSAADPLPRGAGRPKFNQLEMVTTFTYRPIAISSYRGNRPSNKQTHKQTNRGDYNTLRSLARSVTKQALFRPQKLL